LQTQPRQIFADDSFSGPPIRPKPRAGDSARETMRRFLAGQSVAQIAQERGLVAGTIYGHLAEAIEAGGQIDLDRIFTVGQQQEIAEAFEKVGFGNLGGVVEMLGGRYLYGQLRVYRAVKQNPRPS
jgi:ATP-dependent DNA helicase RecQ